MGENQSQEDSILTALDLYSTVIFVIRVHIMLGNLFYSTC